MARSRRPLAPAARHAFAALAALPALLALASAGCSGSKPAQDLGEDPAPASASAPPPSLSQTRQAPDKGIARMLARDNVGLAQATADSLAASKDAVEREIGRYWKAVCYLYRDRPDSAVAILEPMQGKWTGGLRAIHSEAFLRLAREASEARAASRVRRDETARLSHENDAMAKEFGALRAEIARLETEKKKYEKLLKDLETIR
jgi:hypothetical protein